MSFAPTCFVWQGKFSKKVDQSVLVRIMPCADKCYYKTLHQSVLVLIRQCARVSVLKKFTGQFWSQSGKVAG